MVVENCLQLCCFILYDKCGLCFILLRYGTLLLHGSKTESFKLIFPEFNDMTYLWVHASLGAMELNNNYTHMYSGERKVGYICSIYLSDIMGYINT